MINSRNCNEGVVIHASKRKVCNGEPVEHFESRQLQPYQLYPPLVSARLFVLLSVETTFLAGKTNAVAGQFQPFTR